MPLTADGRKTPTLSDAVDSTAGTSGEMRALTGAEASAEHTTTRGMNLEAVPETANHMDTVRCVQSIAPDAERSPVTSTAVPDRHTDNAGLESRFALNPNAVVDSCSADESPAATHYNLGSVQGPPNFEELLRGTLLGSATPSAQIQRQSCGVEEALDEDWMQGLGSTIWDQRSISPDPEFSRFLAESLPYINMSAADCIESPIIGTESGTPPGFPRIASAALQPGKPKLTFSEADRDLLISDLSTRLRGTNFNVTGVPGAKILQMYIQTFWRSFNIHFPLLHCAVWKQQRMHSPLWLAVCGIGALYRLNRGGAANLCSLSKLALRRLSHEAALTFEMDDEDGWDRPRDYVASVESPSLPDQQCAMLLAFYALFSGRPSEVEQERMINMNSRMVRTVTHCQQH